MNTHRNAFAGRNYEYYSEDGLLAGKITVKEAKANLSYYDESNALQTKEIQATTAMMSAYNRIGTVWTGAQYGLQTQILRNEWGFRGAVESDYFGGSSYMDPDSGIRAGNDLMLNTFADGNLSDTT